MASTNLPQSSSLVGHQGLNSSEISQPISSSASNKRKRGEEEPDDLHFLQRARLPTLEQDNEERMNLQAEILKLQHRVQALESQHRKQGLQIRDMREGQEMAANQQRQRSATLEIVAGNTDSGQTNSLTRAPRGLHTSRGSQEDLPPTDRVQVSGEHQSQESSLTATFDSQVMSIPQTTQQIQPERSDTSSQEENKKILEQLEKLKEKNLKLKKMVKRMKEDTTAVDWKEKHDALLTKARRLQSIIYKELSAAQKECIWEFMASNRSTSTYVPVGQEGT